MAATECQRFEIEGREIVADDPGLQELLERIHGGSIRPRCLCVPGGVEMYVARHWRYLIKRLPGTGRSHTPWCPAYELDPRLSGRAALEKSLEERAGKILLRVDFPWVRSDLRRVVTERAAIATPSEMRRPAAPRLSLRALTHLLWEQAGFHRWSPAMEGKRNHRVVRAHLLRAASDLVVQGVPLEERLYIPEPFALETAAAIAERRRQKLVCLRPLDGKAPLAVIIGEFKRVERLGATCKVWVKHLPDVPLLVALTTWLRIESACSAALESRDVDGPVSARLLITALIRARSEGVYEIDAAWISLASEEWILVDHHRELPLLNELVKNRRRFLKPLRYDLRSDRALPAALLLDAGAMPMAMHVRSAYATPAQELATQKALAQSGDSVWVWSTGERMPNLP